MGIFRWAFVGSTALMVGLGFAVLTGRLAPAAVSAVAVLLVVAYLSRERRPLRQPARRANRRRKASTETGYFAAYGGPADGGAGSGGDCGSGGGGGSFGGDGGGGGC